MGPEMVVRGKVRWEAHPAGARRARATDPAASLVVVKYVFRGTRLSSTVYCTHVHNGASQALALACADTHTTFMTPSQT